ncbi:DUF4625 domain-containing protein [Sediminitomix flava]|uniref:Uncharacterized protein DUF4625 n=1 Tax=Sediminitomix flava TaxID=379075 RepID=A0A316A2R2_SEDFL|nr:DUF4625 domain-containing protein [Sediminitomix flava]PWJ43997.1 uncharacterized protein DUF4625 [Sediminitomix flava]
MKKSIIFAASFALTAFMTSCDDSEDSVDKTGPEVTEFEIFMADEEHDHNHRSSSEDHEHEHVELHAGEEAILEFSAIDDSDIVSWKLNIHPNFDGHDHGHNHRSAASTDEDEDNFGWNEDFIGTFDNPSSSVSLEHYHFDIPEYIYKTGAMAGKAWEGDEADLPVDGSVVEIPEGEYHAILFVFDEFGNETIEFKDIHIEHGDHDHEEL